MPNIKALYLMLQEFQRQLNLIDNFFTEWQNSIVPTGDCKDQCELQSRPTRYTSPTRVIVFPWLPEWRTAAVVKAATDQRSPVG